MAMMSSLNYLLFIRQQSFLLIPPLFLLALFLVLLITTRVWVRKPKEQLAPNNIPDSGDSLPTLVVVEDGENKMVGGEVEQKRRRNKKSKKKKKKNARGGACKDNKRETERLVAKIVEEKKDNREGDSGAGDGVSSSGSSGSDIYSFVSFSSIMQRKILQQYDLLVKSNNDEALTISQVYQFAYCLVESRKNLQHKYEFTNRKITINRILLPKADRSSFSRISKKISKLETEKKRLEEDAHVYNRLIYELKHSPAFKAILEISAYMEEANKSFSKLMKDSDYEIETFSFEELLEKEKKDPIWEGWKTAVNKNQHGSSQ